jgi:hypothetical protein
VKLRKNACITAGIKNKAKIGELKKWLAIAQLEKGT